MRLAEKTRVCDELPSGLAYGALAASSASASPLHVVKEASLNRDPRTAGGVQLGG